MGFTVKATYRNETRRFTFSTNGYFPSYDQLYNQLYRVFPISHNYFLSKLLFSPKASQPSRILIAKEVHSAEQYDNCLKPFVGRTWDDALLRFSIFDENPHKDTQSGAPAPTFKWNATAVEGCDVTNSMSSSPPISMSAVPPPPILFNSPLTFPSFPSTSSSTIALPVPMDVDNSNYSSGTITPFIPLLSTSSLSKDDSTASLDDRGSSSGPQQSGPQPAAPKQCCAVSQAKSDIQGLIDNFKADLGHIVEESLTDTSSTVGGQTPTRAALSEMTPPQVQCFDHQQLICLVCFKRLNKSWYKCSACPYAHLCTDCHKVGKAEAHQTDMGTHHTHHLVTCSECPSGPTLPIAAQPWFNPVLNASRASSPQRCSECVRPLQYRWSKCTQCYDHALCQFCQANGEKAHQAVFGVGHLFTLVSPLTTWGVPPTVPAPPPVPNLNSWNPFAIGSGLGLAAAMNPVNQAFSTPAIPLQAASTFSHDSSSGSEAPLQAPVHPSSTDNTLIIHHGVSCDVCHEVIIGARYKCQDCPDYDLCEDHMKSGSAEAHNPFHEFLRLPKPRDSAPISATTADLYVHRGITCDMCQGKVTGTRHKCVDCYDHDHCDACWKTGSAERHNPYHAFRDILPPVHSAPPVPSSAPVVAPTPVTRPPPVHTGVTCDVCNKGIAGTRHKCLDCTDYDQCNDCFTAGHAERHDPFHQFLPIEEPGRVVVHTVYSGSGERVPLAPRQNAPLVVTPPTGPAAEVVHNATCDFCDSRIIGMRYKCLQCPDFDVCSSCHPLTELQHPSHGFVRLSKVDDIKAAVKRQEESRHSACCNFCYKVITGVRFKCMHVSCPDVDLCAQCEALPIPVHPEHHPLLKMKSSRVAVPKVLRAGERVVPNSPITPVPALRTRVEDSPKFSEGFIFNPASVEHFFDAPSRGRSASPSPLFGYTVNQSRSRSPNAVPRVFRRKHSPSPESQTQGDLDPAAFWNQYVRRQSRSRSSERSRSPRSHISYAERTRSPSLSEYRSPRAIRDSPAITPGSSIVPLELPSVPQTEPLLVDVGQAFDESSQSSVKLPVLTLGPSSHFEREFWPRVVDELKHLMQERDHAPTEVAENDENEKVAAERSLESSLAGEALLIRPDTIVDLQPSRPESVAEHLTPEPVLSAVMLEDVNISPGQIFPPGAEFMKSWKMLNDGDLPWPESTELFFAAGDSLSSGDVGQVVKLGALAPGDMMDIWTNTLKAPEAPGTYVSFWKLRDGEGKEFGRNVWIDITVSEPANHSDHSLDGSLASSSIIMPESAPARSNTEDDAESDSPSSPITSSPVTALSSEYAISEAGSDISLVSIPDSEDEEEDWEDSRSHVITSPVAVDPMEYVVLYDDSPTSEEE